MVEQLRAVTDEDSAEFLTWAREITADEGLEPEALAAAALRLAWGEKPLRAPPAPDGGPADPSDMVEIVIPVGDRDRIRPGTIVGKIAGATGLPGSIVGKINVQDRVTFVEVPSAHAHTILDTLDGTRIAGRVVQPRLAHPEGGPGPGPRKPHAKRGKRRP